jgi:hypothetical protein
MYRIFRLDLYERDKNCIFVLKKENNKMLSEIA